MGLFGPSRAELRAKAAEERRLREEWERAHRPPRWVRFLRALPWPFAVVLGPVVVAVLAAAMTSRLTFRAARLWPRPTVLAIGGGWVAAGGPGGVLRGGLPLLLAGCAGAWWHHRLNPPPPPVPPLPDQDVATWRTLVAGGDAPLLPGSTVADRATPVHAPDGRRCGRVLHVSFRDAQQTRAAAHQKRAGIAALWRTHETGVTCRDLRDESRVDIEILDRWWLDELEEARRSRLHDVNDWTGGELVTTGPDAGSFPLPLDAYTGEPMRGRLWTPGAGVHDFDVSGVKGSGKSNAVMVLLSHLLSAGLVVLDLVDLKGGASLGMWRPACFRFETTIGGGFLAVERAIAVMEARLEAMAAMQRTGVDGRPAFIHGKPWLGVECVDPSPSWPVYLLAYDEFPRMIKAPGFEKRLADLNDLSRAADVAVLVIHQSNNAREGWGNLLGIRENITKAGNTIAGRNGLSAGAKSVGADVRLDALPPGTPGAMAVSTPLVRDGGVGRFPFMTPAAIEAAVRAAKPGTLDALALAAVERVEAEHAARQAGDASRRAVPVIGGLPVPSGPSGSVAPVGGLSESEAAIAAAFAGPGRAMKTGEIMAAAGLSSSTFHAARKRLESAGLMVGPGHGQWVATAALYGRVSA